MKKLFLIALAILAITLLPLWVVAQQASFIPQWRPQAQFAGYYVAYKKGFYKKYGIDLKILTGGPEAPSPEYLEKGKVDFATMWLSTAIQLRARGVKIVNIGQIIQRSALMLVARRDKIKKLQDINGHMVGVWGQSFQIPLKAFFKKYRLRVRLIQMSSINLFLRGGVNVTSAMWYNEYHTILMSGVDQDELTTFFLYKYGLNCPEDGIYTLETTFTKYPKLCQNFVKASIEGWLYAFSHPDETIKIVLDFMFKAHVPANSAHQSWMLARMKNIILPPYGKLSAEDYYRVGNILKEQGLINHIPKFKNFYKQTYVLEENEVKK